VIRTLTIVVLLALGSAAQADEILRSGTSGPSGPTFRALPTFIPVTVWRLTLSLCGTGVELVNGIVPMPTFPSLVNSEEPPCHSGSETALFFSRDGCEKEGITRWLRNSERYGTRSVDDWSCAEIEVKP